MTIRNILKLSALLAFAVFYGCKDSSTSVSLPTGNVEGRILPYDSLNHALKNESGFKISLEGTSYFTLSDSTGKWVLSNIPSGTYTIVFSNDHYPIYKTRNLQVVGSGTYYYSDLNSGSLTEMHPLPTLYPNLVIRPFEDQAYVTNFDSTYTDSVGKKHYIFWSDTTIKELELAIFSSRSQSLYYGANVYTYIYFSNIDHIDPLNPSTFMYFNSSSYQNIDTSGLANTYVFRSDLLNAGFTSGDKIYCCAFAGTVYSLRSSSWNDYKTDKLIMTGFSPYHSEVKSFILP